MSEQQQLVSFPQTVKAWAVKSGGGFEEVSFVVESLKPEEAFIKIIACGYVVVNEKTTNFSPLSSPGKIPGHEMVGIVQAIGSSVTNLKPGQRVGVGWQYSSCNPCEYCASEDEIVCEKRVNFMEVGRGGYSEAVVWDSKFVFPLPDNIETRHGGPLMCAGLTVFTALKHYFGPKTKKVAIIGIGGLGHLAIQYAAKMGAEVTALSTSPNKKDEALSFGATGFINTKEEGALAAARSSFDLILNCVSGDLDWDVYLSLLRPFGRLCLVGVPASKINFAASNLIMSYRQVVGSLTGGTRDVKDMLEFTSKHGITPLVEELPISELSKAIEKVDKNTMRYRMVLKIADA